MLERACEERGRRQITVFFQMVARDQATGDGISWNLRLHTFCQFEKHGLIIQLHTGLAAGLQDFKRAIFRYKSLVGHLPKP